MSNHQLHAGHLNRRSFLKTSFIGASGFAALSRPATSSAAEGWPPATHSHIGKGEVILFQGDSITDAGRSREKADVANQQPGLGSGYAWLAAAELLVAHPSQELKVYNRGISGNKVFQLAERWETDCLSLKPNLLHPSIGPKTACIRLRPAHR